MSEGYKGDYAPELFDEEKRYYLLQAQELASLTDAELRDLHSMANTYTRRVVQGQVGDCAIDDGFKIAANLSDTTNNFLVTGGDGSLDNSGVAFLKGYRLSLRDSIAYKDQTNTGLITDDAFTETAIPALITPVGTLENLYDIAGDTQKFITVGVDGTMLRSSNWGRSLVVKNSNVSRQLNSISFGDASTLFAFGNSGAATKSTDGGENWSDINLYLPSEHFTTTFFGVDFVNQNRGYAVGETGAIIRTLDGGGSWTSVGYGTTYNNLRSVVAADTTSIWAVGDGGVIINSDGTGWSQQVAPVSGDTTFYGVDYVSSLNIIACGSNGLIKDTTDGLNWSTKNSDTSSTLYGLHFQGATRGWAVGADGIITQSLDSGATWDSTVIDASQTFRAVFFSDTTGFVVGHNGVMYRTLDATVWERYRTDYVYVDFHLGEVSADSSCEYQDTGLEDVVVGPPNANRLRIVQDIRVSEGWQTPTDYTSSDSTPVQHYIFPLARIQRYVGQATISQGDITDDRRVVRTIAELDYALKNGGVDSSSLAPGSITPDKLVSGADYTFGSAQILGDMTVGGDLLVQGVIHVRDYRTSTITDSLMVSGSTTLGDSSSPFEDTLIINGNVIQNNDSSVAAYDLYSDASTLNAPVFNVTQDGSGVVFNIQKLSDSTYCVFNVVSEGNGYDFCVTHQGIGGGVFRAVDDGSGNSFMITKDFLGALGSVFKINSNTLGPIFDVVNSAPYGSPVSVRIDQTGGTVAQIIAAGNASGISLHSFGSGTDFQVLHDGSSGSVFDVTSSGDQVFNVNNLRGSIGYLNQHADNNALTLTKDSTGNGSVIEVNQFGLDPAVQINTDGSGIGLHVSHVGSSILPAIDIYVAGQERGPALRINKANNDSTDDVGQGIYLQNQGYSQALQILQDNTQNTSAAIQLTNLSRGLDASSINWRIDNSGNFYTVADMTAVRFATDDTHYYSARAIYLDKTNFDATNPGISGRVFDQYGFLRLSDGTNALPDPSFGGGATGPTGPTGPSGGVTGATGPTGPSGGVTGPTGPTGPGSPITIYNLVSRYATDTTAGTSVWLTSSSAEHPNLAWNRSGTTLNITHNSHGRSVGERVLVRGVNVDYINSLIISASTNTFSIVCPNTGILGGLAASYSLGFTSVYTGSFGSLIGITIVAPANANVVLLSARLHLASLTRSSNTFDITVPNSALNGAGDNTGNDDVYWPIWSVRQDGNSMSGVAATLGKNVGGNFSKFKLGAMSSPTVGQMIALTW